MTTTDNPTTAGASFTEATAVVHLHNLHVAWDTDLILHGISPNIPACRTVAVTGSNGSGKFTTPKVLLDTAPIMSGNARFFGRSISARRRVPWDKIGYVPQRISSGGVISASAVEVARSGLLGPRRLWALSDDTTKAMSALERVGVAHRAHSPLNILSGGQTQRVLVARALVCRPEPLVMDGPTAGIDAISRARLAQIITGAKVEGTTILIVLHELGELGPLLDRELHISAGYVSYDGPPHIEDDHEQHYGGGDHCYSTTEPGPATRDRGLVSGI